MPGPRWGEVGFPEQAAAAAITEVGAARPLGAPAAVPASRTPPRPPRPGPLGSQLPACLGFMFGGGRRSPHQANPSSGWAWAREGTPVLGCVGVHPARWATSEHTGLCHPRNVFDQEFMPRGASPGLLIRSHSPGGLPPCPEPHRGPADNSQGTVGGWLWAWALRPTSGGIVTAPHKEDGEENYTASPPLMAAGREPIKVGSVH